MEVTRLSGDAMLDVLDLFTQPAALYEWPALGPPVAINAAAMRDREAMAQVEPGLPALGLTDEQVRERMLSPEGHPAVFDTAYGLIVMSIVPNDHGDISRPPLLLTTRHHQGEGHKEALANHVRILVGFQINETAFIVTQALDAVLQQVSTVLSWQQTMLEELTSQIVHIATTGMPRKVIEDGS